VNPKVEAVLPFWRNRPDDEALDIAVEAQAAGLDTLWIGEMATFDAFALATAIGRRAPGLGLKIGPLAIDLRTPVAICAIGTHEQVTGRISAYFDAGADVVGIVPSTAEDPAGRAVLIVISQRFQGRPPQEERVP
jgi:alkanesulfonate monooxygenase SsuD/methylene tetrahydromethanopterin reductase-like flavin-dependent oxidoreductase (luciferase family)